MKLPMAEVCIQRYPDVQIDRRTVHQGAPDYPLYSFFLSNTYFIMVVYPTLSLFTFNSTVLPILVHALGVF